MVIFINKIPVILLKFPRSAPAKAAIWAPKLNPMICVFFNDSPFFSTKPLNKRDNCLPTSLVFAEALT